MYTTRTTCRSCGSGITPFLNLGTQKLTGWTKTQGEDFAEGPLSLTLCNNPACSLVQLEHTVEADMLFRNANYGYRSGMNQTMKDALSDVTIQARRRARLNHGDVVVDIGSNDSTLLLSYPSHCYRLGYEPVKKIAPLGDRDGIHVINDYFNASAYRAPSPAKIITACAMFYDLEEPKRFVDDVATILHPEGVFVIQLSYLPLMLFLNDWPGICHEHLEYYSLGSLEYLLNKSGLYVFDLEVNEVNGGSLRVYCDKGQRSTGFMVKAYREWERQLHLDDMRTYQAFYHRVYQNRDRIIEAVRGPTAAGKRVYAYTASTKGNVILQFCGLGPEDIVACVERNPDKWGRFTAGSNIPIISEEEFRKANPEYLLVFPWYFMDEFFNREKDWHNTGGRFIVPLPELEII